MKIARVETRQLSMEEGASTLVFLYTDSGIMGVGETSSTNQPETLHAALEEAKPKILGFDPFNVNAIGAMLGSVSDKASNSVSLRVMCGIEAACLDIVGKQLGVPVFQLFGGSLRDDIRICATCWEQFDDTPEDYGRRAREVSNSGFTAIKFDPFDHTDAVMCGASLERAVAITCKIREAVGKDIDLIADANGRFTPSEAIRVAYALGAFGLMWLEDPIEVGELDSLERVASAVDVPLAIGGRMVGGRSFREVIERQLVDFVQVGSHNVGGISRTRNIGFLAESYYMRFALHHSGGPVSLAMNAHVAACASNLAMVEVPYPPPAWWDKVLEVPLEQRSGFLKVPLGSGLGIEYQAEFSNQGV
jgi:galactonate dehydratase